MELVTHNDIWQNYIFRNASLSLKLCNNFHLTQMPSETHLIYDLRYATAMTRIFYARIEEALPSAKDENAIWEYYKKYYNTPKGAAQKDESIKKYHDFVQHQR